MPVQSTYPWRARRLVALVVVDIVDYLLAVQKLQKRIFFGAM